jgi:hypothetical protein
MAMAVAIAAATAVFSLVALSTTVRLMTVMGQEQKPQTSLLLTTSFLKLPVVGAGLYFGIQFAEGNYWMFAGSLVWVYLCAVWYLVASRD